MAKHAHMHVNTTHEQIQSSYSCMQGKHVVSHIIHIMTSMCTNTHAHTYNTVTHSPKPTEERNHHNRENHKQHSNYHPNYYSGNSSSRQPSRWSPYLHISYSEPNTVQQTNVSLCKEMIIKLRVIYH